MSILLKIFPADLGVDLGTSRTIISKKDGTILIDEPSVVAIDMSNYEVRAVGNEAKEMLGKTPDNILAVRPLEHGVIADFETAQAMLTYFLRKAVKGYSLFQPRLAITIPMGLTDVERRSVEDVGLHAGARDVRLVEENIASAVGLDIDVERPDGHLLINVGAGTIEASVVSLGGVVASHWEMMGGEDIDSNIQYLLKKNFNLLIGIQTAEEIKIKLGSIEEYDQKNTMEVTGRDLVTGMPKTIQITASDIIEGINPIILETVKSTRDVLEKIPPDISADIVKEGIYFLGGVSQINGFAEYITSEINIDLLKVDHPESCTGAGIGRSIPFVYKKKKPVIK
ncbi:rod shape-determining protein [Gallicola sp. Sow4_E12]|uniref:rod shape-determining protein n=1 Tax=Gallicola sp. Sow4_E12 TaxID=3438785 RepID=UPI003F90BE5F